MPIVIPDGYAQCVVNEIDSNVASGRTALVLGFGAPPGPVTLEIDIFAQVVKEAWNAHLAPVKAPTVTLDSIYVATATASVELPGGAVGTANLNEAPPNVAALVSKVTTAKGRRGRGRMYLHGVMGEEDIDERGNFSGARRALLQTGIDNFFDFIASAPSATEHVILQGSGGQTPPISPPPVVLQTVVQGQVATQRRRLRP